MNNEKQRAPSPEEFAKLKQRDMYEVMKSFFPEVAKGKSRARKEELVEAYGKVLRLKENYTSPTGRLVNSEPNPQFPNLEQEKAARPGDFPDTETVNNVRAAMGDPDFGATELRLAAQEVDAPVGRRTEIEQKLEKVPLSVLQDIDKWSRMPTVNRYFRRKKAALGKKLRRRLPKGVSLVEAAAVVS